MPNCFVKRYSKSKHLLFKNITRRHKYCEILLVGSCSAVSAFSLRL